MKRNDASGPRLTNLTRAGAKRAAEDAARNAANPLHEKAAEKAVGSARNGRRRMSHQNKSKLVRPDPNGRGARTKSGARPGSRPGTRRSSGKKPSATNLSRGGGSAAMNRHNLRSRAKSKSGRSA